MKKLEIQNWQEIGFCSFLINVQVTAKTSSAQDDIYRVKGFSEEVMY